MCLILPVSHIPCTHTVSIWQHCVEATRSGSSSLKPCWNVCQHERAILSRKLCKDCGGARFFARRGGVAERGNGSPPKTPDDLSTKEDGDGDDDSGYHSDVIHEEDRESDLDEFPLSPRATSPPFVRTKQYKQRKQNSSSQRSLSRKLSWKPNLKRDLALEYSPVDRTRRDSIDSLLSKFDDNIWHASRVPMDRKSSVTELQRPQIPTIRNPEPRKGRSSTLLHPSSPPPMETFANAQVAKSFPFPEMVDVRKPSSRRPDTPTRKRSTLLHPSPPAIESTTEEHTPTLASSPHLDNATPSVPMRQGSSLLQPSCPLSTAPTTASYKTIISIPPNRMQVCKKRPSTLLHPSSPGTSLTQRPIIPPRRMPPLHTNMPECQSATMAKQRRESVIHSCLSDTEDEGFDEPSHASFADIKFTLDAFELDDEGQDQGDIDGFRNYGREEAEGVILANTARAVRASRRGRQTERRG